MNISASPDVIVIGLGALGAATFHQLAARGVRVLGIDQFSPPHKLGSSHGESRITRLAIGEGEAYVPLVRRSHALWRELESTSGEEIFTQTGGLIMAPKDRLAAHHGKTDFVRRTIEVARRHGVAHEVLGAPDVAARWPQFGLVGDELAYYEPEAGFLRPEAAIAAQLAAGRAAGGHTRLDEAVLSLETTASGVSVTTTRGRYTAARTVVAAGAWLPAFLGRHHRDAWARPLRVYRQVMHWFDASSAAADFTPQRLPVFIWMFGDAEDDYMYGFPSAGSEPSLKVATEQYAASTSPEAVDRNVSVAESNEMYTSRVAGRFPAITGRVLKARACLYTVTPDRHFLIDALDDAPQVLIASACSGHGFKHSAGLGEAIAQRLAGDAAAPDLSFFARRQ
ncbi:MAG: N-methyl-L-tryptophan oxidase [Burkholderiaceae bacterium]